MAVTLRLSRGGSKKRPFFRIVAADVRAPRDGRYLERLGTYNPMKKKDDPERITLNKERIQHWISVGARPSLRVTKFLALQGLAEKPVIPKQTKQDKPRKKTLEKQQAKEEKLKSKKEMSDAAKTATDAKSTESSDSSDTPAEQPAEAKTAPEQKPAEQPAEAKTAPEQKPAEQPAEAKTASEQKPAEQPAEKITSTIQKDPLANKGETK